MHAAGGKNWDTLSAEEQQEKVVGLSQLLSKYELGQVKPMLLEQIVLPLKSGAVQRQQALMVEGSVGFDKSENVKNLEKEAYSSVLSGLNPRTAGISIDAKRGAGDPYLTIEGVTEINTGKEVSLNHKPGQVFLIDFWATWCPPCQAPMAHNQHMLEQNGAKWGDNVRIIGISIDQTAEAVVKHVDAKGWKSVEHFHKAGSSADDDYGVQGVPHVVLIDTNGKIAYAGHPASR